MKRIIIVEDDAIIASDLELILLKMNYEVVGIFDNGEEAIQKITEEEVDLVLLDISLSGKLTGIDVAEALILKTNIPFIFITSYFDKKTIETVDQLNPAAFIVKPFQEKNLMVNIELAFHKVKNKQIEIDKGHKNVEQVFVKNKHELLSISPSAILYIEAYDNYAYVYTATDKYLLSHTLKSIEDKLSGSGFLRIHKSYLINIKQISSLQEGYAFIKTHKIPVGKSYKQALMNSITVL